MSESECVGGLTSFISVFLFLILFPGVTNNELFVFYSPGKQVLFVILKSIVQI